LDNSVEEKNASHEDYMTKITDVDANLNDEQFVNKVAELIGEVKKNENKTLHKDTFIKIFKYTGDFAKLRSKGIKLKAQEERSMHFDSDHKLYLEAL